MNKAQIYFVFFLIFIASCLLAYYYIFNIYEVTYSVKPKVLYAENSSKVEISTIPLNALGTKVPFRCSYTVFNIREGRELVEKISENCNRGKLILRTKNKTGKIVIFIKSNHAILPSSIEIKIYPNLAFTEDKTVKKI